MLRVDFQNGGTLIASSGGVPLAVGFATLDEETLTLQVYLAGRAVEALRVPVFVQGFNPAIARFDWELAAVTLRLKEGRPVSRAID